MTIVLVACGVPSAAFDAALGSCTESVALEVRTTSGEFARAEGTPKAELVLGFQGFKYVYVRARLDGPMTEPRAEVRVELDGGAVRSQPLGRLRLYETEAADFQTDPIRVFFNDDPLPSLIDRGCGLTLKVEEKDCQAKTSAHVVLSYDPGCYEGPDGQRECPDAAPPSADGGTP